MDPTSRKYADQHKSIELRDVDHAKRHCGAGVGRSERSNAGQSDVEVIVHELQRERRFTGPAGPNHDHLVHRGVVWCDMVGDVVWCGMV